MANDGVKQLQKIDHIVVLMMENRSFDQMLGYLMRDGLPEVDGLRGDEWNEDAEGNRYPVRPCDGSEPLEKRFDPCHGPTCVSEQLENGNKGFVKNFVDNAHLSAPTDKQYRDLVMRYYTREQLPVYDELARAFCVCDRWHSSVPGDTWPNRSYSITGGEGKKSPPKFIERIPSWFPFSKKLKGIENAPIYDLKAFTRHLDNKQWRWYAHDPAILRGLDKRYRKFNVRDLSFNALNRDNFAYFDRRRVSLETRTLEAAIVGRDSFLDDAVNADPNDKTGLRDVSWIDPNFIDLRVLEANSNDDHPPADVRAGQALVLDVYEALYNSPDWEQTLLVVLYDEHGGFYDHVSPPPIGDTALHSTLGVRVPAMVIGPRVKEVVCHELFDHTTVIKTILKRFAPDPDAAIAAMGPRVATAQDLEVVLGDEPRSGLPDPKQIRPKVEELLSRARDRRRAEPNKLAPASDGAGHKLEFQEFQEDYIAFAKTMRNRGLPSGQP